MTKATKIIIVASVVIALLLAAIGTLIALNIKKSPERNPVGTVLETKRRKFVTNYRPYDGVNSDCAYKAYSLEGHTLNYAVDYNSLQKAINQSGQEFSASSDGFIEGIDYVEVDAEVESVVVECSAVVPEPIPEKRLSLRITKLYSINPASTFPRH